jgi:uncharacterized protein (TIGR02598 family)
MKIKAAQLTAYGFSIIEIVMVVAVAGAIVLIVANIPASINLIGKSNHEATAKEIAQQTVEDYRSRTYANIANGSNSLTDSRFTKLPGGTGVIVIEDCPQTLCQNGETVKKLTVTVSWNEKQEPRSVILTTLVAEGGLH